MIGVLMRKIRLALYRRDYERINEDNRKDCYVPTNGT